MQVMVTFRHVEPTDGLRQYATEKVQRVHKFLRRPLEAHVIMSVIKHRHIVEIQVSATRLNVTATEETGDLYSAIDLAMDKVERQIKKHVTKRQSRKSVNVPTPMVADAEPTRTMIRTERIAVKPMSVDEAVLQLALRKNGFLLFKNAANETLSLIYRRKDGNYGLIEPEIS